jgi:hypothetical protein
VIRDDIDRALGGIEGDTRLAMLRRTGLMVLRERFAPSAPPLRIQVSEDLSVTALAHLSHAIQQATSLSAKALLDPQSDSIVLGKHIRESTPLIPRLQTGHMLLFGFPEPEVSADHLDFLRPEHLAERAVREFLAVLPQDANDNASLEALPARRSQFRAAVSAVARAVSDTDSSLTFTLRGDRNEESEEAVLTSEQTQRVPEILKDSRIDSTPLTVEGLMDGMRTQRRVFFILENETGREYQGSIEEHQLEEVRDAINTQVRARLIKAVQIRGDGSHGRPSYRLLGLIPRSETLAD